MTKEELEKTENPEGSASGTVTGWPTADAAGTVADEDDDDFVIPEDWNPSVSPDEATVTSRKLDPTQVTIPAIDANNMPGESYASHILSPEQLRQHKANLERQALIDRGASYAGKSLKQLMKENPSLRPFDMRQAINAYNQANGEPEMGYLDTIAFYAGKDPYQTQEEAKKEKRRMAWAEGINGIADVLQSVVNLSTASDNSKHNATDMTNYHRQLRKNLDEQRVKRLGDLMAQIKADNDAKKAAALKQQEFQQAIYLKQLEWQNPKVALELKKAEADIKAANIKSQVEAEKLIQERLITQGLPEKLAAELAKSKAQEMYYNAKASEARQGKESDEARDRYYRSQADEKDLEIFKKRGGDVKDRSGFERYLKTGYVRRAKYEFKSRGGNEKDKDAYEYFLETGKVKTSMQSFKEKGGDPNDKDSYKKYLETGDVEQN